MRILVTGGTGFVGSHLAQALIKEGHDVIITGNDAEQFIPGVRALLRPGLIGIDWDAVGEIDVVFHQAGFNDAQSIDEREMMHANVEASKTLFMYAAAHGCKKIIFASSTAVYGDGPVPLKEEQELRPLNAYARSKVALESYAHTFQENHPDVAVIGLRYANVYGEGESHKGKRASMVYHFAQQLREGNPTIFGDGEQRRDFIYIQDVVAANMLAMRNDVRGIFNCGSGVATSFNDIVSMLASALGLIRTPVYVENPHQGSYQMYTMCDMSRAKKVLGFIPSTGFADGIKAYAANLMAQ